MIRQGQCSSSVSPSILLPSAIRDGRLEPKYTAMRRDKLLTGAQLGHQVVAVYLPNSLIAPSLLFALIEAVNGTVSFKAKILSGVW